MLLYIIDNAPIQSAGQILVLNKTATSGCSAFYRSVQLEMLAELFSVGTPENLDAAKPQKETPVRKILPKRSR